MAVGRLICADSLTRAIDAREPEVVTIQVRRRQFFKGAIVIDEVVGTIVDIIPFA
jgi:hypothetical protein